MRGFNAATANKLLVMVDGRTVYSPLFTGVFWNTIDYVLEDIERIEVIRGPGATLWGANAMNGVINIVTRSAADTPGTSVLLGGGREETALAAARVGARLGAGAYRVYGKYDLRDAQQLTTGASSDDRRVRVQAGMRYDVTRGASAWMLTADALRTRQHFSDLADGEFTQGAAQLRWSRGLAGGRRLQAQAYYHRETGDVPRQIAYHLDTMDVDVQYGGAWRTRHELVTGGGYRLSHDHSTSGGTVEMDPSSRWYSLANVFVQDDVAIVPSRVFLTGGVKLEYNSFSGVEWQPTARVRFDAPRGQTLWAAVSRPVRRPTRLDVDLINRTPTGVVVAVGNEAFQAETMRALDVGYRITPAPGLSAEVVAFAYTYDRLRSASLPPSGQPPALIDNGLNGTSRGIELALAAQVAPFWRVTTADTHQRVGFSLDTNVTEVNRSSAEGNDPRHVFVMRHSFTAGDMESDLIARAVGALPSPAVPGYTELDARVAFLLNPRLEIALIGRDLLHGAHPEFGPSPSQSRRVELERAVRLQIGVRF
jgi:iron complex outermembrane receptor protein